ncbi:MAG TPA: acetate--CoA ligase family protein [Candidatus Dormibacteraeota bacterium]
MQKTSEPATKLTLEPVFKPKSIAVIGASPSNQWGKQALQNLKNMGYEGKVAAVNPKYTDIIGYECYPSVKDIPFVPDAVLINVNRERTVQLVEEAAEAGAKSVVMFAIGFAEAGPEWRAAQERIVAAARDAGMVGIGPNCQGVINFVQPSAMWMGPVYPYPAGSVAMFAQSGSVTSALANNKRGVRWSHIVSCGNEAVSGAAELIGYFVDDPHVKVICGFMETIRNPERFFHECDRAREAGKPVVIFKSGRSEAGQKFATVHSGALAAPYRMYDELFKRHGVLRVDSTEELLETCIALQSPKKPAGGRLAVVTASGGQIELSLDEVTKYPAALSLPAFEPSTKDALREILPEFLATNNPLDYWGVADYITAYRQILELLVRDENVDVVVGVSDPNSGPTGEPDQESQAYDDIVALAGTTQKPIVLITPMDGEPKPEPVEELIPHGVLLLSGFPEGYRALERLVTYQKPAGRTAPAAHVDGDALRKFLHGRTAPFGGQAALEFLALAGIPTTAGALAGSGEEAIKAARKLGYPVVVKSGDEGALHKTDKGGVHLNLDNEEAVRHAAELLVQGGAQNVLVQFQIRGGVELIAGLQTDAALGKFVLVGLGGVLTEIMNDAAMRPAGLLDGDGEQMLRELRMYPLLEGARGARPADQKAIVEVLARLDAVGHALGGAIQSIDINPLIALPSGVMAVDALIVPSPGV